jgi:hypothetical protein
LTESSPPPDTASSQAQSRKAFRDRMQALLEKVTTLCSLPPPQPHFSPTFPLPHPPPPPPPPNHRPLPLPSASHAIHRSNLTLLTAKGFKALPLWSIASTTACALPACLPLRAPVSQLTAGWHTLEALMLRTSSTCCACIRA